MTIPPVITISNADGYNSEKQNALNDLIVTERNRWTSKVAHRNSSNNESIYKATEDVNSTLFLDVNYVNDNIIFLHGWINTKNLRKDDWTKIVSFDKEISAAYLYGTASTLYTPEKDAGALIAMKTEEDSIYLIPFFSNEYLVEITIVGLLDSSN